jgi:hypothetical protein
LVTTEPPQKGVALMPLTNTTVKNAKPAKKSFKVFDERELYLEVSPKGGKW